MPRYAPTPEWPEPDLQRWVGWLAEGAFWNRGEPSEAEERVEEPTVSYKRSEREARCDRFFVASNLDHSPADGYRYIHQIVDLRANKRIGIEFVGGSPIWRPNCQALIRLLEHDIIPDPAWLSAVAFEGDEMRSFDALRVLNNIAPGDVVGFRRALARALRDCVGVRHQRAVETLQRAQETAKLRADLGLRTVPIFQHEVDDAKFEAQGTRLIGDYLYLCRTHEERRAGFEHLILDADGAWHTAPVCIPTRAPLPDHVIETWIRLGMPMAKDLLPRAVQFKTQPTEVLDLLSACHKVLSDHNCDPANRHQALVLLRLYFADEANWPVFAGEQT